MIIYEIFVVIKMVHALPFQNEVNDLRQKEMNKSKLPTIVGNKRSENKLPDEKLAAKKKFKGKKRAR